MSQITDQIKERLGIAEVTGQYLKLERVGSNYKALCPFHNEKTPSFMVNTERNFWYCFGCQKGGDIFSFLMEMEGLDFRSALEKLADQAGVEIPRFQVIDKKERDRKQAVLAVLELATKFFQYQLKNSARGKEALEYLFKRKIQGKTLEIFRVGYAPEGWRTLLNFLVSKGHRLGDIAESGLLVRKENGDFYDRFRDRIIYPVIDQNGLVVGFSARVMPGGDEKTAKYINTPQTFLYDKSKVLYGLFQGKTEIKKKDYVIIVEGNMDVISSHVGGVNNVVAVSGTALTVEQVKILRRYTNNFGLCFDMDQAGQNATARSVQTCLKEGVEVEIIQLDSRYKDFNDLLVNDQVNFQSSLSKALPVMEYFFQSILQNENIAEVKGKKRAAQKLLNIIKDIADPIEQGYWLKKLSVAIKVDEEVLTKVLKKAKLKKETTDLNKQNVEGKQRINSKPRLIALQQRLLGLFSLFQKELKIDVKSDSEIDSLFFPDFLSLWEKVKIGETKECEKEINECAMNVRYYYDQKEGFIERQIDPLKEWKVTVEEIKKEKKKKILKNILWDLKKASESGDNEAVKLLTEELARISKTCQSDSI